MNDGCGEREECLLGSRCSRQCDICSKVYFTSEEASECEGDHYGL